MTKIVKNGIFYAFDEKKPHRELVGTLGKAQAIQRVTNGKNIYTPARSDAKSLAKSVYHHQDIQEELAHAPNYFRHFHPRGDHSLGHVFFGARGDRFYFEIGRHYEVTLEDGRKIVFRAISEDPLVVELPPNSGKRETFDSSFSVFRGVKKLQST